MTKSDELGFGHLASNFFINCHQCVRPLHLTKVLLEGIHIADLTYAKGDVLDVQETLASNRFPILPHMPLATDLVYGSLEKGLRVFGDQAVLASLISHLADTCIVN